VSHSLGDKQKKGGEGTKEWEGKCEHEHVKKVAEKKKRLSGGDPPSRQ